MSRIARVVVPEVPHHITQRGNRRLQTFFCDEDYEAYRDLMSQWCTRWGIEVWAYCLMPNHVHLIAVPPSEKALSQAIGEAHRRYTRRVNFREGWRGHLWQGRFASFPMDKTHLYLAARYVELNPVRAKFVKKPQEYRWSSAAAHIAGREIGLCMWLRCLKCLASGMIFFPEVYRMMKSKNFDVTSEPGDLLALTVF